MLTDDPNWYYEGRVAISAVESGKDYSTITFSYNLDPFKLRVDTVPGLKNLVVDESLAVDVSIGLSPMRTVPRITADVTSTSMTATLHRDSEEDLTTNIHTGSYRYPALVLGPGWNQIEFTGSGTVSIEVRGGSL